MADPGKILNNNNYIPTRNLKRQSSYQKRMFYSKNHTYPELTNNAKTITSNLPTPLSTNTYHRDSKLSPRLHHTHTPDSDRITLPTRPYPTNPTKTTNSVTLPLTNALLPINKTNPTPAATYPSFTKTYSDALKENLHRVKSMPSQTLPADTKENTYSTNFTSLNTITKQQHNNKLYQTVTYYNTKYQTQNHTTFNGMPHYTNKNTQLFSNSINNDPHKNISHPEFTSKNSNNTQHSSNKTHHLQERPPNIKSHSELPQTFTSKNKCFEQHPLKEIQSESVPIIKNLNTNHSNDVLHVANDASSPRFDNADWQAWLSTVREFFQQCSNNKQNHSVQVCDLRPYLRVRIYGVEYNGLLDSGSEISILGGDTIKYFEDVTIHKSLDLDHIVTANGSSSPVTGYVFLPVMVGEKVSIVKFYIIPGVSTKLLFGINFWKAFDIAPDVLNLLDGGCTLSDEDHITTLTSELRFLQGLESLSLDEQNQAECILKEFQSISSELKGLGRTSLLTHYIDTGEAKPIKQRYYMLSPSKLEELNRQLDEMLELDVVEPSSSSWNNPVTMAPKADGTLRFCLDSRKLNEVSKHDAYPLPYINQILDQLGNAKFLSSLDLKSAFWQIPLDPESKEKTAFTIPTRGLFHFKVMCYGLTSAPATQQRLMDILFGPEYCGRIFIYLDDIIVVSETFSEHLTLLRTVLERLQFGNLTINLNKCKFFRKQLKYLGFVVDEYGLRTDPDKVKAIIDFPVPTNRKDVKRFLGTASYYRRFIKNFSNIAGPLNHLTSTKKGAPPFRWSPEADNAFSELKKAMTTAPVLACPDFSKPFTVHCDASDFGIGGTLTQEFNGEEHPLAYYSRSLSPPERNYSATEREALAVVNTVEHFRPYLEGSTQFKIITDHSSLKWFLNLKNPTGRLERWGCRLSPYNFIIEHRRGSENIIPDALSRSVPLCLINPQFILDDWYNKIRKRCEENPASCPNLQIINGRLYRYTKTTNTLNKEFEWKEVIPADFREEILHDNHSVPTAAHLGTAKTYKRLKLRYYWPGMYSDVVKYVANCAVCAAYKHSQQSTPGFMGSAKHCSRPMQCLSLDLVGPLPPSRKLNTYLLVIICCFSKYCMLFPLRRATGKVIAQRLDDHVFMVHGVPRTIIADNASYFTGGDVQRLFTKHNIPEIHLTPVYTPQINTVERYNKTVMIAVASFVEADHRTWDVNLPAIQFAMNTSVNDSTDYTPYFLMHGREAIPDGTIYGDPEAVDEIIFSSRRDYRDKLTVLKDIFSQVEETLQKAHDRNIKYYNEKRRDIEFEVGDEVWKRTFKQSNAGKYFAAKLAPKYEKCRVIRKLSKLVYELEDETGKPLGKWHVKDCKPVSK